MKAKIYQSAKAATQSGRAGEGIWILEYVQPTARRPEPLMGWTASGDTLNQVRLRFQTLEEAQAFAQGKGFDFTVSKGHARRVKPRNYGDNFKYVPPEED